MKFANTSGMSLDFELHGKRYKLAPHETVEIPDRVAYAVGRHGLPLVEAAPDAPVTASAEPAPSPAQRAAEAHAKVSAELQKEFEKEEEALAEGKVPADETDDAGASVDDVAADELVEVDAGALENHEREIEEELEREAAAADAPVTASAEPGAPAQGGSKQQRRRR